MLRQLTWPLGLLIKFFYISNHNVFDYHQNIKLLDYWFYNMIVFTHSNHSNLSLSRATKRASKIVGIKFVGSWLILFTEAYLFQLLVEITYYWKLQLFSARYLWIMAEISRKFNFYSSERCTINTSPLRL